MATVATLSKFAPLCRKLDRAMRAVTPEFRKNGNILPISMLETLSTYDDGHSVVWNLCKKFGVKKTQAQAINKIKAINKTDFIRQMALILKVNPSKEIDHRW